MNQIPPGPRGLFDDVQPARPTDRLFFAIFPDAAVAARIAETGAAMRATLGLRGAVHRADRLHVTLHHLGDYAGVPADVVAAAGVAAARVDLPSFALRFDQAASFAAPAGQRPFVLRGGDGLAAVERLRAELGRQLVVAGLGRRVERRYTPHLTLLYDERIVAAQAIEPIGWTAHDFVLVHSLLGRTEHRVLGRWALCTE